MCHAKYNLWFVKRKDHLILDGYPTFIVLENHKRDRYFWTYCTENNKKAKIKYDDVDAIYKVDDDTGELILHYSRKGRDEEFFKEEAGE